MPISRYFIAAMDCPTEEQLIRNRLKSIGGIEELQFDLIERILTIRHAQEATAPTESALAELGMHARPLTAENGGTVQVAPVLPRQKIVRLALANSYAIRICVGVCTI